MEKQETQEQSASSEEKQDSDLDDVLDTFSKSEIIAEISKEQPCGQDIRNSQGNDHTQYAETKSSRHSLRKQELIDLQESSNPIKQSAWEEIIETSGNLLAKTTKDIEILCWFLEGLVRVHGIKGLIFGFAVFIGTLEKYQKNVYPTKEEGEDDEERLMSIAVLNGQRDVGSLVLGIYMMPILNTQDNQDFNIWQIKKMLEDDQLSGLDFSTDNLRKSKTFRNDILSIINTDAFDKIYSAHSQLLKKFSIFNQTLSNVFSSFAPNIKKIEKAINVTSVLIKSVFSLLNEQEKSDDTTTQETTPAHQLSSREKALANLDTVIAFFEEYEPHSPATYCLKRAHKWFNSSLEQIMVEVLEDTSRYNYCKITGVPFKIDDA